MSIVKTWFVTCSKCCSEVNQVFFKLITILFGDLTITHFLSIKLKWEKKHLKKTMKKLIEMDQKRSYTLAKKICLFLPFQERLLSFPGIGRSIHTRPSVNCQFQPKLLLRRSLWFLCWFVRYVHLLFPEINAKLVHFAVQMGLYLEEKSLLFLENYHSIPNLELAKKLTMNALRFMSFFCLKTANFCATFKWYLRWNDVVRISEPNFSWNYLKIISFFLFYVCFDLTKIIISTKSNDSK